MSDHFRSMMQQVGHRPTNQDSGDGMERGWNQMIEKCKREKRDMLKSILTQQLAEQLTENEVREALERIIEWERSQQLPTLRQGTSLTGS